MMMIPILLDFVCLVKCDDGDADDYDGGGGGVDDV